MSKLKSPAISVIMSIYNQKDPERLRKAIYSILGQSFHDFEFIIYNDGSDDDIYHQLAEYAKVDERIIVLHNSVNQGLAYSLNACIDVAKGKYLARMDDDDISSVNRFRVQYEYLEKHSEVAFVGCNASLIDDDGVWGHRMMPENPAKKDYLRFSPFIHPTVMIRRSVLEEGNNYNTSKETLRCEDYELFMRLNKAGYLGHNIQQELFYYREDKKSYHKRTLRSRAAEMRVRYANFKDLKLLSPIGFLYVIRPLISAIVPAEMILHIKQNYHKQNTMTTYESYENIGTKIIAISPDSEKGANVI
ncbi:MAG: glycosyltransferase [Lachnospiraceae bacterium]|nr:glycosyltransferase [Lachnospiraceae bacterium]